MTCVHPLRCLFDGVNKPIFHSNYKDYNLGQTYFQVRSGRLVEYTCIDVSCGKCVGCGYDHSKKWIMRLSAELLTKPPGYRSCFVTLTYNNDNIPFINGQPTLDYTDVQKFIKKIRRFYDYHDELGVYPDKYYCVGEYGDQTKRPHYHLIIFGVDFREIWDYYLQHDHGKLKKLEDYIKKPIRRCGKVGCGSYEIKTLSESWDKGYALVGNCTNKSIAYCSGYMVPRKVAKMKMKEYYGDRVPEKPLPSKGIGREFYEKFKEQIFEQGLFHINGYSYAPDKTFKAWLSKDEPELYARYKQKMIERTQTPTYIQSHSRENLHAKELILLKKYQKWLKHEDFIKCFGKEGAGKEDFQLPE